MAHVSKMYSPSASDNLIWYENPPSVVTRLCFLLVMAGLGLLTVCIKVSDFRRTCLAWGGLGAFRLGVSCSSAEELCCLPDSEQSLCLNSNKTESSSDREVFNLLWKPLSLGKDFVRLSCLLSFATWLPTFFCEFFIFGPASSSDLSSCEEWLGAGGATFVICRLGGTSAVFLYSSGRSMITSGCVFGEGVGFGVGVPVRERGVVAVKGVSNELAVEGVLDLGLGGVPDQLCIPLSTRGFALLSGISSFNP